MALTWGSIRIIGDRKYSLYSQNDDPGSVGGKDILDAVSQDDIWGFGQVVAVALLAAPLFVFFENIYGKCERFSSSTYIWTIGTILKYCHLQKAS